MYDRRNFLTFGSPHQGEYGAPRCNKTTGIQLVDKFCKTAAKLLLKAAYNEVIMDKISVAQYYHDPFNKQVPLDGIVVLLRQPSLTP